jgi:phage gp46-like protein
MNLALEAGTGALHYDSQDPDFVDVYCSLTLRKGSWFVDKSKGSRIHLLKKNTLNNQKLVVDYANEALQWLIDAGRFLSFQVSVFTDKSLPNYLGLIINAQKSKNQNAEYKIFVKVV